MLSVRKHFFNGIITLLAYLLDLSLFFQGSNVHLLRYIMKITVYRSFIKCLMLDRQRCTHSLVYRTGCALVAILSFTLDYSIS